MMPLIEVIQPHASSNFCEITSAFHSKELVSVSLFISMFLLALHRGPSFNLSISPRDLC